MCVTVGLRAMSRLSSRTADKLVRLPRQPITSNHFPPHCDDPHCLNFPPPTTFATYTLCSDCQLHVPDPYANGWSNLPLETPTHAQRKVAGTTWVAAELLRRRTETEHGRAVYSLKRTMSKRKAPDDEGPSAKRTATLNKEQQRIVDLVRQGRSVLGCGEAGTGKTHVLRELLTFLNPNHVALLGPTGTAAAAIGGVTLHSFFNLKKLDLATHPRQYIRDMYKDYRNTVEESDERNELGDTIVKRVVQAVSVPTTKAEVVRAMRYLVIDEVSMVSRFMLDVISGVCGKLRGCPDIPFGGIKVLMFGDFRQLPPVAPEAFDHDDMTASFCFESHIFQTIMKDSMVQLVQNYRQSGDFAALVQRVGLGRQTEEDNKLLRSRVVQDMASIPETALRLMFRNNEKDRYNNIRLSSLKTKAHTYNMTTHVLKRLYRTEPKSDAEICELLANAKSRCVVPARLELKEGARVVLRRNLDVSKGLTNGTQGVVVGFSRKGYPIMQPDQSTSKHVIEPIMFETTYPLIAKVGVRQVPLNLGWAITIHGSQGMQARQICTSIKDRRDGLAYVALSRCLTLDGVFLYEYDQRAIKCNHKAQEFYDNLSSSVA